MDDEGRRTPRYIQLEVKGDACIILDVESCIPLKNPKDLLLKWYQGDGVEIWIDRFDVRNYFNYKKLPECLRNLSGANDELNHESEEEVLLDKERYKDFEEKQNSTINNDPEDEKNDSVNNIDKRVLSVEQELDEHSCVNSDNSDKSPDENLSSSTSQETQPEGNSILCDIKEADHSDYIILNGMQAPKCKRLRAILHKTAMFVRNNKNPQVEFLICVNQRDNVDLSFMQISDRFYKYYTAVKSGEVTFSEEDEHYMENSQNNSPEKPYLKKPSVKKPDNTDEEQTCTNSALKNLTTQTEYYDQLKYYSAYTSYPNYYFWNSYPYFNNPVVQIQRALIEPEDEKLKGIIEKVANFVQKNGPEFEEKVRKLQSNNPDFNFLNPQNQYYLYYKNVLSSQKDKQVMEGNVPSLNKGDFTTENELSQRKKPKTS